MGQTLQINRRVPTGVLSLVGLIATIFLPAISLAQSPKWAPDVTLGTHDSNTTGVLSLTTTERPQVFSIKQFDAEAAFQMVMISGDRELPMDLVSGTREQLVFEGEGCKITLSVKDEYTVIADYEITDRPDTLAVLDLRANQEVTTSSLTRQPVGVKIQNPDETVNVASSSGATLRRGYSGGAKLVLPLEPGKKARFILSVEDISSDLFE